MRTTAVATCLALLVTSCGRGELSLTEYADEVEGLTTILFRTLENLTVEGTFAAPTVEEIQAVYGGVATAFHGLLEGLEAIEPPKEVAELHTAALDMATNLAAAGDAFARRTDEVETEDELSMLFDSPEALAVDAAREEMVTFCQERQAEFDATSDREVFADTPWIPSELQEVVLVAFGCGDEGLGG